MTLIDLTSSRIQIVEAAPSPRSHLPYGAMLRIPGTALQCAGSMSKPSHQVILIRPEAPLKPAPGAACNGCGVCCLLEPCPLGVVLSRHRHGACVALCWHDEARQYRCSVASNPVALLERWLPWPVRRLANWQGATVRRLVKRWIAAGQGCDSVVELTTGDNNDFIDNAR